MISLDAVECRDGHTLLNAPIIDMEVAGCKAEGFHVLATGRKSGDHDAAHGGSANGNACHVQSYDGVLRSPRKVVKRTLDWLGLGGNLERAIKAVRPMARTQQGSRSNSLEPEIAVIFDAYYDAVDRGDGLEPSLIERMNRVHQTLLPQIEDIRDRMAAERGYKPIRDAQPDLSPFTVLDGNWA